MPASMPGDRHDALRDHASARRRDHEGAAEGRFDLWRAVAVDLAQHDAVGLSGRHEHLADHPDLRRPAPSSATSSTSPTAARRCWKSTAPRSRPTARSCARISASARTCRQNLKSGIYRDGPLSPRHEDGVQYFQDMVRQSLANGRGARRSCRKSKNRRVVLAARPKGLPKPSDFRLEEASIPKPQDGEVLLQGPVSLARPLYARADG